MSISATQSHLGQVPSHLGKVLGVGPQCVQSRQPCEVTHPAGLATECLRQRKPASFLSSLPNCFALNPPMPVQASHRVSQRRRTTIATLTELIHCGGEGRTQALSVAGCHCLLSVACTVVGPEAKFRAPFSHLNHLYWQKMPFPGV